VFINDPRHGDRFVKLLPGWQLPGKRADHGRQLRAAGLLIEIQGVAAIGG